MSTNISKYISLSSFLLLEYEFSRDGTTIDLPGESITPVLAITEHGTKQYFNINSVGDTNNDLIMQSVPVNANRGSWYNNTTDPSGYYSFFDSSTAISGVDYAHDTVKVHIVSGYNFDDISGFLLQVGAKDTSGNIVDLSNFTWFKQVQGTQVLKFSSNTLYLGNKFYDKYTELKIPSVQELGGDTISTIGQALSIEQLSDVYLTYSTVPMTDNNQYIVAEKINVQLPVESQADNFNCLIAESTAGDYITFYATWNDLIIGEYMSDIESGRIRLYTSNNPNDNYEEFTTQYGVGTAKWVVMHEVYVYEHIPGGSSLLTQKFVFTQEDNFSDPNYFRPVIHNSDIIPSYSIDYICRLTNRMDGTQIIRKASFSSNDPAKYGKVFDRLNVENVIPYNVFNKIEGEKANIITNVDNTKQKFVKVFVDSTNIVLNSDNTTFPQGTGPLFLRSGDAVYKFNFSSIKTNVENERQNLDLSGMYDYRLAFVTDDDNIIEISPTYSINMNTVLGEIEFKVSGAQSETLLKQDNNKYIIRVKNPDGTSYTFYEGVYHDYKDYDVVIGQYSSLYDITDLQQKIKDLEIENEDLRTTV